MGMNEQERRLEVARRVRMVRGYMGDSQQDLAKRLGMSQSTFRKIEDGERELARHERALLAEVSGFAEEVLSGEVEPNPAMWNYGQEDEDRNVETMLAEMRVLGEEIRQRVEDVAGIADQSEPIAEIRLLWQEMHLVRQELQADRAARQFAVRNIRLGLEALDTGGGGVDDLEAQRQVRRDDEEFRSG